MRKPSNPMPTVEYDGKIYKLRSRKTLVPDFKKMGSLEACIWLNRNTTPRGYQKAENPLAGFAGAINVVER